MIETLWKLTDLDQLCSVYAYTCRRRAGSHRNCREPAAGPNRAAGTGERPSWRRLCHRPSRRRRVRAIGNYHRVPVHILLTAGFGLCLISSIAFARTREALHEIHETACASVALRSRRLGSNHHVPHGHRAAAQHHSAAWRDRAACPCQAGRACRRPAVVPRFLASARSMR